MMLSSLPHFKFVSAAVFYCIEGEQEQEFITTLVAKIKKCSALHSSLRDWDGLITAKVREAWLGTQGEWLCEVVFAIIPEGRGPFLSWLSNLNK